MNFAIINVIPPNVPQTNNRNNKSNNELRGHTNSIFLDYTNNKIVENHKKN